MDEKKNKEDGSYEFIKETIKKKPLDRKKCGKQQGFLQGQERFLDLQLRWFLQL